MNDLINTRQYIAVYAEALTEVGWNVGANEVDQLADVRFIESVIRHHHLLRQCQRKQNLLPRFFLWR